MYVHRSDPLVLTYTQVRSDRGDEIENIGDTRMNAPSLGTPTMDFWSPASTVLDFSRMPTWCLLLRGSVHHRFADLRWSSAAPIRLLPNHGVA